jgi:light-regulated signal transduction histidine kinase (bacteriophytochrome)
MDSQLISECELEPLSYSGAIQSFGAAIVIDAAHLITHVSANLADYFPDQDSYQPGRPLPRELARFLPSLGSAVGSRWFLASALEVASGWIDIAFTRNQGGQIAVEITRAVPFSPPKRLPRFHVINSPDELQKNQQEIVERVFELTGFQRVMYYHFLEEGDGEVIAEKRDSRVYGSYLGLRYPASDIPQIARNLYLLNPWRLIADAHAEPVPLLSRDSAPPDLTYSDLRSASPVHRLYLKNMGVRASLSFPLIHARHLVGLIACHHASPMVLSPSLLAATAKEVSNHSLSLSAYLVHEKMKLVEGLARSFHTVRKVLEENPSLSSAWSHIGDWLLREFRADGAWLQVGDQCTGAGIIPSEEIRAAIGNRMAASQPENVWVCHSLSAELPHTNALPLAGFIGVQIRLSDGSHACLVVARREYIYEVAWGGNPEKPLEPCEGAIKIAPRQSFEKWVQMRKGYCHPWDRRETLIALNLRNFLLHLPLHF